MNPNGMRDKFSMERNYYIVTLVGASLNWHVMIMRKWHEWVFAGCFVLSLIIVALALSAWGAAEVRGNTGEVSFLTFVGVVWLIFAIKLFAWLGLSFRDDVVERRNIAALVSLCGAIMAVGTLYAGGSLGEGPSYWDNIFSAGLATAVWLVLWILLELGAKVSISIAEERDLASGLRMCGFLLGIGLMLG